MCYSMPMSYSGPSLGVQLQVRDLELLRGLYVSRLMTLGQIAKIHFDGKTEMAKKRVQKLKAAGFLSDRKRKPYEPSILFLTRTGFTTLSQLGILQDLPQLPWAAVERRLKVSELTLRHELEVMNVKAAFHAAFRDAAGFSITAFETWPALYDFTVPAGSGWEIAVKPDSFVRIQEERAEGTYEHIFFIEVDRSTEALNTLLRRARAYLAYYQSGGLAERFGRPRSDYRAYPFRVLMLFKTVERRNNFALGLLHGFPPIFTQVWLSTIAEATTTPLEPIWVRPIDYRALSATPRLNCDPTRYRRSIDRDHLIARAIQRSRLFDG